MARSVYKCKKLHVNIDIINHVDHSIVRLHWPQRLQAL